MHEQRCLRPFSYSLIILGCMLAIVSAVVPHYGAGYKLMLTVLLSGIVPYLVYAVAVPYLCGWLLALPGLGLVIAHGWLVVAERFVNSADYSDGMIYYMPAVLAVLLLPLAIRALRVPWGEKPETPPQSSDAGH